MVDGGRGPDLRHAERVQVSAITSLVVMVVLAVSGLVVVLLVAAISKVDYD